jgi:putative membrane protein
VFARALTAAPLPPPPPPPPPHPRTYVAAFFAGITTLAVALLSPVEAYASVSFTVHMAQHLLLTLVAPPLLALGAPVALALRATSAEAAKVLARFLRTDLVTALANPIVGWLLFVGVAFGVHLTPLFDLALRHTAVHAVEHALWLGAALVFWWPIVGRDPSPHPVSFPARMLSLTLAMPAMSFLALAVYASPTPLYRTYVILPPPWGTAALADQHAAATMMWLVGNLTMVVSMLLVAAAWKRDEDATQRRLEGRAGAVRQRAAEG